MRNIEPIAVGFSKVFVKITRGTVETNKNNLKFVSSSKLFVEIFQDRGKGTAWTTPVSAKVESNNLVLKMIDIIIERQKLKSPPNQQQKHFHLRDV